MGDRAAWTVSGVCSGWVLGVLLVSAVRGHICCFCGFLSTKENSGNNSRTVIYLAAGIRPPMSDLCTANRKFCDIVIKV